MFDDCMHWAAFAVVTLLALGALACFWHTKTDGWGPYTTSTFIIVLVISITAVLAASGLIAGDFLKSVFWAAVGFASGVFTKMRANTS